MDKELLCPPQNGDFFQDVPYDKYINFDAAHSGAEKVYDIRDFGADTSHENNADAINKAITHCNENGGGVVLVAGGQYTTSMVVLKSSVCLLIEKDSLLRASHDLSLFEKAFITAHNCSDIKIMGPGKIIGEGEFFNIPPIEPPLTVAPDFSDIRYMDKLFRNHVREGRDGRPDSMFLFDNCSNVCLENLIIENSMNWCVHFYVCENILVKNVVINNNRHIANADGIDLTASSHALIEDCFISTADDGVVLKSLKKTEKDMCDIVVRRCEIISATNPFKIGTETFHNVSDILVEDCIFSMPDLYPGSISGIAIETADGSVVENVKVRNIKMDKVSCPIFIRACVRNRFGEPKNPPIIKNVLIEDVFASDAELPMIIAGTDCDLGKAWVADVKLKNIEIINRKMESRVNVELPIPEYETRYPESWFFYDLPAYGLWVRNAENIVCEEIKIVPRDDESRPEVSLDRDSSVVDIVFNGVSL